MDFEKIQEMLADYKGIDPQTITRESTFAELGFDSLDVAEMVMKLEDEFSVSIELDAAVKTVADLMARMGGQEA